MHVPEMERNVSMSNIGNGMKHRESMRETAQSGMADTPVAQAGMQSVAQAGAQEEARAAQQASVPTQTGDVRWTPEQAEAITRRGQNLLVAAAAGSGKTAVLVERIKRLILEEQSANTRQNLQNSLALLPDDYHKTVAIVTNDFHMGRVRLLLNAAGPGRVVQVPAKLPWWWLSANYYLRESFAVVNDQVVRPLLA